MITFIGAMVITFDTPVLRLIDGPQWAVLFWRMALLSASVFLWWGTMTALKRHPAPLINGWPGMAVIALYAAGNVTFITAVFNTSVANVVFILALTPLFAALMSFIWFRERLRAPTWAAFLMAMAGVAIIVGADVGKGSTYGNLMAAATAATLAMALTITRRTGKDMSMSPVIVGAITATFAFIASGAVTEAMGLTSSLGGQMIENLVATSTEILALDQRQWGWMLVNGMIIMPLSYSLLALGPRYITASEVALFLLLETALAPIWVWLAVGETVPLTTIIGGCIILVTLIAHSLYKLRIKR